MIIRRRITLAKGHGQEEEGARFTRVMKNNGGRRIPNRRLSEILIRQRMIKAHPPTREHSNSNGSGTDNSKTNGSDLQGSGDVGNPMGEIEEDEIGAEGVDNAMDLRTSEIEGRGKKRSERERDIGGGMGGGGEAGDGGKR